MEDYDWELHGVEDDFHRQFAAELEVLAELEGGCGPRRSLVTCSSTGSWPAPGSLRGLFSGEASEGRRQQRPEAGVGGRIRERKAFQRRRLCVEAGCLDTVTMNLLFLQVQRPCHPPGALGWARSGRPLKRLLLEGMLPLPALQVDLQGAAIAVPEKGSWPPAFRRTGPCSRVCP